MNPKFFTRAAFGAWFLLMGVGIALAFLQAAQGGELESRREGSPCDWQCQTAAGELVSCHQRQDKAGMACANAVLETGEDHFIVPAVYRISRNANPAEPLPENFGAATLSWDPPRNNTDGTPLEDLAGYIIAWDTDADGDFDREVRIDNPTVTSYVVEDLAPGTYTFTSYAYNAAGVRSEASNTATKTVE